MKVKITVSAAILGILFSASVPITAKAQPVQPTPNIGVQVLDGNTLYAARKRIRLWGITVFKPPFPGGQTATNALTAYVQRGSPIHCSWHKELAEYDVATCRFSNGTDIACAMVATGYAIPTFESRGVYNHCVGIRIEDLFSGLASAFQSQ